jgi:hypothetical protein
LHDRDMVSDREARKGVETGAAQAIFEDER